MRVVVVVLLSCNRVGEEGEKEKAHVCVQHFLRSITNAQLTGERLKGGPFLAGELMLCVCYRWLFHKLLHIHFIS